MSRDWSNHLSVEELRELLKDNDTEILACDACVVDVHPTEFRAWTEDDESIWRWEQAADPKLGSRQLRMATARAGLEHLLEKFRADFAGKKIFVFKGDNTRLATDRPNPCPSYIAIFRFGYWVPASL